MRQAWRRPSSGPERKNRADFNLYFTPNLPHAGRAKKPRKADIEAIRCLYADVDAKDGRTLDQALDAVVSLPLQPTLIIASGGGYQPIWALDRAVPATPEATAWAEAAGAALARMIVGDAVQNIDRILRLPFTMNYPDAKKRAAGRAPCLAGVVLAGDIGLPRYTQDQLTAAFPPAPGGRANTAVGGAGRVLPFPGKKPAAFTGAAHPPDMNAAAQAGMAKGEWFGDLPTDMMNALVRAILAHPEIARIADALKPEWLPVVLACAHAEQLGATEAYALVLDWAKTSARYKDEADFLKDWKSFKSRPDGTTTTVGTLLAAAKQAGFDLGPWRSAGRAANEAGGPAAGPAAGDHRAAEAGGTALTGVVRGAPFTQMPTVMTPAEAAMHLNARLGKMIDWGGRPCFARFNSDGSPTPLKAEEVTVLLSGHVVVVPDGKSGTKHIPAATWWTQHHPGKVVFDAIRYDPENKHAAPGERVLNTWRGFAIEPAKGSWRRMRWHIWAVLCGRDGVAFKYLIRWLAHAVQHPGTNPEVMVVLRSDMEGVGKSSLGQWMLRMFGAHGREIADASQVFGQFNDALDRTSFVLPEEPVFPGDHRAAGTLKAMLTARTLRLNPKGRPAYEVPHCLHFMMTTNGGWAIPAGAEARRFLMLDAKEKMPRSYFDDLWAEAEAGGIAAMLHDLLAVDLTKFTPRDVPATRALVEQQRQSADDVTQWITDAVFEGVLLPGAPGGGFGSPCASHVLRGAYLAWAAAQGIRRPNTSREFGRALSAMGLTRGGSNNPPMWTIPDRAALLAHSDRRAGIRQPRS